MGWGGGGGGYVACMGKLRNRRDRISHRKLRNRRDRITVIDSGINRTRRRIWKVTDCLTLILLTWRIW